MRSITKKSNKKKKKFGIKKKKKKKKRYFKIKKISIKQIQFQKYLILKNKLKPYLINQIL